MSLIQLNNFAAADSRIFFSLTNFFCNIFFETFQIIEVEEEMRELLKESAQQKRHLEDKLKKVTQAFSDLQSEIL